MALSTNVWMDVENGFQVPATTPIDAVGKALYTFNAMEKNPF